MRGNCWFCRGTSPTPPGPPFCPPPLAEGLPAFWVPLVAGLLMWATRPLFWFRGETPPTTPARGLRPLDPPSPPSGLRVCQRSEVNFSPAPNHYLRPKAPRGGIAKSKRPKIPPANPAFKLLGLKRISTSCSPASRRKPRSTPPTTSIGLFSPST